MLRPRMLEKAISTLSLLAFAWLATCGLSLEVRAQTTAPSPQAAPSSQTAAPQAADVIVRGIELYKQGDDKGALKVLRRVVKERENEIAAWHYIGLIYSRMGKTDDARKAHEKAAKSGEWLLDRFYTTTPYPDALASIVKYRPLLLLAAESAGKYLELTSNPSRSKAEEWNNRAEMLRDYVEMAEGKSDNAVLTKVYSPKDVEVKARLLTRPEPGYTDAARNNQVTGTVVLRAIFSFDGKVRAIKAIKGLPDGLTYEAIRAARRIKFVPATINGKPVSQYIQIEYNFNIG